MTYGINGAQLYGTNYAGNIPYSIGNGEAKHGYTSQDLIEFQRYLAQQSAGMSVPSFAASRPETAENKGGLGFVGWATIIGTLGAIAYGIKKGKFDNVINCIKEKIPAIFKQKPKIEYRWQASQRNISPDIIDASLPPRTEPLKGEARNIQQALYDNLFGAVTNQTTLAKN